jgi:hypothetical protein
MEAATVWTCGDLRAEIARRQLARYWIAGRVGVHPGRLGQMLNERVPMPPEVAEKISAVVMGTHRAE